MTDINFNTIVETIEENPSRENTHPAIIKVRKAKDLLKNSKPLKIGDFVTIKDDKAVIESFIVERIDGDSILLCGIKLTEEKDDIIPYNFSAHISEVLYIGESFVRVNGVLWTLREQIMMQHRIA